jgi:prefoldin alpha subunit
MSEKKEELSIEIYDVNQLQKVPINQLVQIRQSLENEVNQFTVGYRTLSTAYDTLLTCADILEPMKREKDGTEILVPITSSLYIPGKISSQKVLVDVGTGYYIETVINKLTTRI